MIISMIALPSVTFFTQTTGEWSLFIAAMSSWFSHSLAN